MPRSADPPRPDDQSGTAPATPDPLAAALRNATADPDTPPAVAEWFEALLAGDDTAIDQPKRTAGTAG